MTNLGGAEIHLFLSIMARPKSISASENMVLLCHGAALGGCDMVPERKKTTRGVRAAGRRRWRHKMRVHAWREDDVSAKGLRHAHAIMPTGSMGMGMA